ncbi:MAG: hypothetical protein O2797_02510 [Bacteroidetes bacterium]|nr:hypothetical protein [Bacteroidota bacterium]
MRKYELTDDLEGNPSLEGNTWIPGDYLVNGNARVYGDASGTLWYLDSLVYSARFWCSARLVYSTTPGYSATVW